MMHNIGALFNPQANDQYLGKYNPFSDAIRRHDSDVLETLVSFKGVNINQPIKLRIPKTAPTAFVPRGKRHAYDDVIFGEHPLSYLALEMAIIENNSRVLKCASILLDCSDYPDIENAPSVIEYLPDHYGLTPADYAYMSLDHIFATVVAKDKLLQDIKHGRPLFFPKMPEIFMLMHQDCVGLNPTWITDNSPIIVDFLKDCRDNLEENFEEWDIVDAARIRIDHINAAIKTWDHFHAFVEYTQNQLFPKLSTWAFVSKDYEPCAYDRTARDMEVRQAMDMLLGKQRLISGSTKQPRP